jgi:hypothetical protein
MTVEDIALEPSNTRGGDLGSSIGGVPGYVLFSHHGDRSLLTIVRYHCRRLRLGKFNLTLSGTLHMVGRISYNGLLLCFPRAPFIMHSLSATWHLRAPILRLACCIQGLPQGVGNWYPWRGAHFKSWPDIDSPD